MKKYGFGVDIGGTTCKIGLFEMNGTLVEDWEIKTNTENKGASILEDVAASIEGRMQSAGIKKEEVQGIGVGVPGPVTDDGTVLQCVNLGWGEFNVADVLKKRTGFSVKVGNDANVAALGEMWQGGGKGHKDVVMVTLGTGVGGGIIVGGKIVAGANGAGGEIGHIMVNEEETDTCGCGKKGCLEQYASATGIVRMAKKLLVSDGRETVLKSETELTAKAIFDAAKADDTVAKELVEELGKVLGNALANVACVVNPEIIVIGGGVSKAGSILIDVIKKHYMATTFHACKKAEFALATLGNQAGMYGCVQMLLDM